MKKKILLIGMIFLFTGCTTNYNLTIDNNTLREKVEINIPSNLSDKKKDKIDDFFSYDLEAFTDVENGTNELYNIKKAFVDNGYIYQINHDFLLDEFANSKIVNDCFSDFQYKNADEYIAIKASGKFACRYDNKKVNINITTDRYVQEQNADSNEGNTYTWTIDSSNENNANIEMMIYKNIPSKTTEVKSSGPLALFKNIFITVFLIVFAGLSGFGINKLLKKIDSV